MAEIAALLALRIIGLIGATAATVGFVALFVDFGLENYKWPLFLWGTAVSVGTELIVQVLARWMIKNAESDSDDDDDLSDTEDGAGENQDTSR